MNDVKAPRNAQSRSPRPRASSQPESSEQLGELEFSDWYETPVFEPDEDELLEEAATSGHGPRRLMARMVLARDARKALRRPQWDEAPSPARARPEPTPAARMEATPRATPAQPAPQPARRRTPVEPEAAAAAKAPAATPEPAAKPADTPPREPAIPKDRWSAWATSGPSMDEQTMRHDLDRDGWRRRIDTFLDRWAAAEVAVAARLDRSIEKVLSQSESRSLSSLLPARREDSD